MRLSDISTGSDVFIDTNIFFYQIVKHPTFWRSCEVFLQRVMTEDLQGFTSVVVLNELLYKLVLAEVAQRQGLADHQAYGFIKQNPRLLRHLQAYESLDKLEAIPNLHVVEVKAADFTQSRNLMKKYQLLPSDALHLAVMQYHEINHLASNDAAFRQVKRIKVYLP